MINLMPFWAEVNKYMYFIICLSGIDLITKREGLEFP